MKFINEKNLKYLPSKKFTIIICIGILLIIIFIIFFTSSKGEVFSITGNKKNADVKIENQTIESLVEKDTDGDGIPDWEEALWGTDKNKKITFSDTPDSTYIANKKKELNMEKGDEIKLTETEKFARQFFSSYTAMKSSGQVDSNTINSFSNALGQKIVNPNLIDVYKESDIKINDTDDSASRQKYYADVKKIFQNYKSAGIGDELDIISKKVISNSTEDADQSDKLISIANAYKGFAKKIMEIDVPQSLITYQLRIANSSNDTGISVSNMEKVINDPIVGLSGISQYQKYSNDLITAVADLETFLVKQ